MGRELTRRHSGFFQKRIRNPFEFVQDVYQYGKFNELVSFAVWEVLHRLRLFPAKEYLRFSKTEPLTLDHEQPTDPTFAAKMTEFFGSKGLQPIRSEHNWKLLFLCSAQEMLGCLNSSDRDLYRSTDGGKTIVLVKRFPEPIKSIFVSSKGVIFVCVKGFVFVSADDGATFTKRLDLGSPESFFRHNNAMTEAPDGTLMIGEYGNIWDGTHWRVLAYVYFSFDGGETWTTSDFLFTQGVNKHVHIVKYSKSLDRVFIADGDNKKQLWVTAPLSTTDFTNPGTWQLITKRHIQMGGYTSVVEANGTVLFGTDYQGGTNFLVSTRDGNTYTKQIVPDPYRRSPIDNMVLRKSKTGTEIWANLPYSTAQSKCLLMVTNDGGDTWDRLFEYSRATHKVWLVSSSVGLSDVLYVSIEDLKNNQRVVYQISDSPA